VAILGLLNFNVAILEELIALFEPIYEVTCLIG